MRVKSNELRGKILAFLRYMHPDSVDEQVVVAVYYQYYKHKEIISAIEYLADRHYISKIQKPHPYKEGENIRIYKIMPDGIDVCEGIKTDAGIMKVDW